MPQLRLKDYLVITGGILLIALSLSFAHVNPAGSAADETVRVVNTPLPVTLQGTGTISGTVAATQSGTWNVGINGTPMFNLANPADIAKAEGIQHPYQKELECGWPNDNNHCDVSFTSPTNQRLVIEYVSGSCNLNPGMQLLDVHVITTVGGVRVVHSVGMFNPAGGNFFGNVIVQLGQAVRIYADQGTQVEITVLESGVGNTLQVCGWAISGQAVDVS